MRNLSNNEFEVICLLSVYVYLKEKYSDLNLAQENRKKDANVIAELLKKIEKFAHIPNKTNKILEAHDYVIGFIDDKGDFDEESFLNSIKDKTSDLSQDDRNYLLNVVIYVAHTDKKISDNEKEAIIQVAYFLNLDTDFKKIMSTYESSEFAKSKAKFFVFSLIAAAVIIISVSAYFILGNTKDKVVTFNQKSVVFSEINFNRFVVYKNFFPVENDHLQKQAVFYLNGSAEVAFNSDNLVHNKSKNQIILKYDNVPFELKPLFKPTILVDEIYPKEITKGEARKVGAFVGVAGTIGGSILGAKAGGLLKSVLPPPYNVAAPIAGGALGGITGGAAGYFLTVNALDGMKLVGDITPKEKREVIDASKALITATLQVDDAMLKLYKKNFKNYIKAKYAQFGYNINDIKYEKLENKK